MRAFVDDGLGYAIFGAIAFALFWLISQRWSWTVFMTLGVLLTFGIPLYFMRQRK